MIINRVRRSSFYHIFSAFPMQFFSHPTPNICETARFLLSDSPPRFDHRHLFALCHESVREIDHAHRPIARMRPACRARQLEVRAEDISAMRPAWHPLVHNERHHDRPRIRTAIRNIFPGTPRPLTPLRQSRQKAAAIGSRVADPARRALICHMLAGAHRQPRGALQRLQRRLPPQESHCLLDTPVVRTGDRPHPRFHNRRILQRPCPSQVEFIEHGRII